jgi:hypothetical protein
MFSGLFSSIYIYKRVVVPWGNVTHTQPDWQESIFNTFYVYDLLANYIITVNIHIRSLRGGGGPSEVGTGIERGISSYHIPWGNINKLLSMYRRGFVCFCVIYCIKWLVEINGHYWGGQRNTLLHIICSFVVQIRMFILWANFTPRFFCTKKSVHKMSSLYSL